MPSAALSAVPAWPAPKLSCSLSVRSMKPFRPSGLADGVEALFAAGEQLVDVAWWLTSKTKLSAGVSKT